MTVGGLIKDLVLVKVICCKIRTFIHPQLENISQAKKPLVEINPNHS